MSAIDQLRSLIELGYNEAVLRLLNRLSSSLFNLIALLIAAEAGNLGLVKQLWRSGCDVNVADSEGRTPLALALSNGHYAVCYFLLAVGADVVARHDTALGAAVDQDAPDHIVTALLDRLCSQASDEDEAFARILHADCQLYQAVAARRSFRLAQFLAERGQPVNAAQPLSGLTALHLAVSAKAVDLVRMLLEHGADPLIRDARGFTALYRLYEAKHPVNIEILSLVARSNARVLLLTSAADGVIESRYLWTNGDRHSIAYALREIAKREDLRDYDGQREDAFGSSMLHYLAANKDPLVAGVIAEILPLFDLNLQNIQGLTPLCLASLAGNPDMVRLLLEHGADPNAKAAVWTYSVNALTILYAMYPGDNWTIGHDRCLEELLYYQADPQLVLVFGRSCLMANLFEVARARDVEFKRVAPIIAHIAMLKESGTDIYRDIEEAIESRGEYRGYYKQCRYILKKQIAAPNVKLVDLLTADFTKIIGYLQHTPLFSKFQRIQYTCPRLIDKYKYYWNRGERRARIAIDRDRMRRNAMRVISVFTQHYLRNDNFIVDRIVFYLSDNDLRALSAFWRMMFR